MVLLLYSVEWAVGPVAQALPIDAIQAGLARLQANREASFTRFYGVRGTITMGPAEETPDEKYLRNWRNWQEALRPRTRLAYKPS